MLGNGSINTFTRQRIREWTVLPARAVPRSYKENSWGNQVSSVRDPEEKSHLEVSHRSERTRARKLKNLPLEAFTRELLVKAEGWNGLW
jgi:hypothetical protein